MKNLTIIQKNFIVKEFFKSDLPGGVSIAHKLLEKGECIVAGNSCIWNGGIGNFIKTEKTPDSFDCLTYKFDLDEFLKSSFFQEYYAFQLLQKGKELKIIQDEYLEIRDISLN